jgi:Protein of unknown function (DUF1176)
MHRGIIAFILGVALPVAVAAHSVASPPVSVGTLQTFKDWTVGCDNGLSCQAVALMPKGTVSEGLSLAVTRSEGVAGAVTIKILGKISSKISGFTSKADGFRVIIDDRAVLTGTLNIGSETIRLAGASALKLARAIGKGRVMRVTDGSGTDLGAVSLSGASAALRYIDVQQGRASSKGAVIAIGRKAPSARKAVLPVLTVTRIKPTGILPDTPALVTLSENSSCADKRVGSTEDTAYSLGTGAKGAQALIMLNCGAGAYNFSSGIYIGQRDDTGKWTFEPAAFDYGARGSSNENKIPVLVNADWDAAGQTINSFAKGRGLGDCGSAESWIWDGSMFRLTKATAMGECRGSLDWIPIWRADVRFSP